MRTTAWIVGTALLCLAAAAPAADDKKGIDDEGFLQQWLVLAPIPFAEGESGVEALNKEQLKGEASLKPKAGEIAKVGSKELTWKKHECQSHLLDFNAYLGNQTEDSVAYAYTVVMAPEEMKGVKMKTGSDDQAKVYLNGKEVFKNTEARPAEKDQDTTEVTLNKGANTLLVKVVNEKIDWSCCVRFTDKDDKPLTNLKCRTGE